MGKEVINKREVEASIDYIIRDKGRATIDFWDGDKIFYSADVAIQDIPEGRCFEGARLCCVIKTYTDGSKDLDFKYPSWTLEELRKFAEEDVGGMPPMM